MKRHCSLRMQLFHWGARESSAATTLKYLLISVVLRLPLVVVLHIVPIYKVSYFVIYSSIAALPVEVIVEVRRLGGVNHVVFLNWQHSSHSQCALYDPSFSYSCFHCIIVNPIYIDSIEMVISYELSYFSASFRGIETSSGWWFSASKSRNKKQNSFFMVLLY